MNSVLPSIETFYLTDFHRLPETPGIYSWHLVYRDNSISSVEDYYKFFKSKYLKLKVNAALREDYVGELYSKESLEKDRMENLNGEILEKVTHLFSPPIYIGITRDQTLKERLNSHKSVLQGLLNGSKKKGSKFAERVYEIICDGNLNSITENNFFVKVVSVASIRNGDIMPIEYVVNRTYHPLCGKK